MKVTIAGVPYEFSGINGAPIGDVRNLKKITKGLVDPEEIVGEDGKITLGPRFQGVTAKTFQEFAAQWSDGYDPYELLSDESFLLHLQALVYLCRRAAGDEVTFDDCSVPLDSIGFDQADDEEEVDPGAPKDDTASDPATTSEAA
jgi:hypothetical protein